MPEYYSHLKPGVTRSWVVNARLQEGAHVHTLRVTDEHCAGGDSECPIFGVQLEEALEAWQ